MFAKSMKLLGIIAIAGALGLAAIACSDDDTDKAIDEFLATNTPEAAASPATDATEPAGDATEPAPEETAGTELTATEGGCVHGTGESTLYIVIRGLQPDERITGTIIESPEGGLVDPAEFSGTADADGRVSIPVKIKRFGTYRWNAGGVSSEYIGQYTVEAECPGEPQ